MEGDKAILHGIGMARYALHTAVNISGYQKSGGGRLET